MFISDFIKYIQAPEYLGVVSAVSKANSTITVAGNISSQVASGAKVRIQGISATMDLIYTVDTVTAVAGATTIKVKEEIPVDTTITSTMTVKLCKGVDITATSINLAFDNKEGISRYGKYYCFPATISPFLHNVLSRHKFHTINY